MLKRSLSVLVVETCSGKLVPPRMETDVKTCYLHLKTPYPTLFWLSCLFHRCLFCSIKMPVRMKKEVAYISIKILFYICLRQQKARFIWSRSVWPLDLWFNLFATYFMHFCSYLSVFGNCQNQGQRFLFLYVLLKGFA